MYATEKSLITGYQKMHEPFDIPTSLMIFQTLESENSASILSFASFLPSFVQSSSRKKQVKRYVLFK